MRRISARISSRSLASRLDSGSSISTSGGSTTIARAIATRCCWPPESWPGSLSLLAVEAHHARAPRRPCARSRPCGRRCMLEAEADVLAHAHVREQRVVLEHHAEAALLRARSVSMRVVVEPDAAARSAGNRPARQLSVVDLPQPDGPSRATNSPLLDGQSRRRCSACMRAEVSARPGRAAVRGTSRARMPMRSHSLRLFAPPICSSQRLNA